MTITFRPGRLPNDPAKPRLKLGHFLTADVYAPPAQTNWDTKVSAWGVLGNDDWGDCHWAASYHGLQTWTANTGTELVPATSDVLTAYAEATGFDPHAGPPGRNFTDQGTVMQDGFSYWRKRGLPVATSTGIVRHRIYAFAEVDHRNPAELETASALFGEVFFGISFPRAAMDAFNDNQPWDVWDNDGGIDGGHAICSARYDAYTRTWWVITWGAEQEATQAFLDRYLDEAWVIVAPEWVAATGGAPSGLDLPALGTEFTRITGEPAPWAADTPPAPRPHLDALVTAARNLAVDQGVHHWLTRHHGGETFHVARLVQAVVDAAAPTP